MKTLPLLSAILLLGAADAAAEVIAQWNFNDTNAPLFSPPPSLGAGAATTLGGISAALVGGASADAGTPNKAWNTSKYPAATTSNKLAGVRFAVDTTGYENISLSWYQENSDTASRYGRLQYTVDGVNFVDAPGGGVAITKGSVYTNRSVNLGAVAGVTNNPFFGFQFVTEFEASALGSGTNAYVATAQDHAYSTGGTIHFDLVTVSGTPVPDGNIRPYIFPPLADQVLRPGENTGPLPFVVLDAEDPAASLTLFATSSDPTVVPVEQVVFGGYKSERTVTVTPGSQSGTTLVTILVTDTGGKGNSLSFQVTVLPSNDPPVISSLPHPNTVLNRSVGPLSFTVEDRETPADRLTLSYSSANPLLLPADAAHISLGGSGTNRTVTLTPGTGQLGIAPLTLSVSDGSNSASSVFSLMVTPSTNVVFYEPFDYPDGPLLVRSGFRWGHRLATASECLVTNGWLLLAADQAEDPKAPLVGAPFAPGNGTVLYAAFKLRCLALPKLAPGYFAHFAGGSTLRGRLYAGTTNAMAGFYHLFVANQNDTNSVELAANLSPNSVYTVVLRYNVDAASTTLWLNPGAESDVSITAVDGPLNPVAIDCFDFREDTTLGNGVLLVDDLKVGLTFASVVGTAVAPAPLSFQRQSAGLVFSWSNPVFSLAAATNVAGPYLKIPGASSPWTNRLTDPAGFFRLLWP